MARTPKEWAEDFIAGASCTELTKLKAIVSNPWTGAGRYYASRTGVAKAEIDRVFNNAAKRCGGLGGVRRRRRRK